MEEGKHEDILKLMRSYQRHFQFATSLENGIKAFNLAVDNLNVSDMDDIREILSCIADQFSDDLKLNKDEKEARMKTLEDITHHLSSTEEKQIIENIFRSLSQIPPTSLRAYKLHRV